MAVRVGLMGFGRIGRNLFRILYKHDTIQIVAISDIADHKGLEYLLKYDTIMGRFPDGSVAKLPFRGKIRRLCIGKSRTCESKLSCFR